MPSGADREQNTEQAGGDHAQSEIAPSLPPEPAERIGRGPGADDRCQRVADVAEPMAPFTTLTARWTHVTIASGIANLRLTVLRERPGPPRTHRSLIGLLRTNSWKPAVSGIPNSR